MQPCFYDEEQTQKVPNTVHTRSVSGCEMSVAVLTKICIDQARSCDKDTPYVQCSAVHGAVVKMHTTNAVQIGSVTYDPFHSTRVRGVRPASSVCMAYQMHVEPIAIAEVLPPLNQRDLPLSTTTLLHGA